jgi:arylsulfatase/arylsulfatase A
MLLVLALALAGASSTPRPNLVLVVTDDQGPGDFSHAGHGVLETPHLDRLAAESPKVTRFYVSPVCSLTRASLMTGRYSYRTRVVDTWLGRSMMDPDELTLAEILREAGYATGIFGKWHLGDCYPMRPMDQGFDESLVHRGGGLAQPSEPPENAGRYTNPVLFRNGEPVATEGYCTDVFFDAALEHIDRSVEAGRRFFAYVATNTPHDPFHDVPRELYAKYRVRDLGSAPRGKGTDVDREARICAMIENIDQNVGRLLAHLQEREVAQQTIVVFLGDNGPLAGRYTRGLRGSKGEVYEGGIRAPLFFHGPERFDPEVVVTRIAAHVDLLPTLLEMLRVDLPEDVLLDGRSLVPLLAGGDVEWPARRFVLQAHRGDVPMPEHNFAMLDERWKLVRASGFGRRVPDPDQPFELFDLLADPGETTDVAEDHPGQVKKLRTEYAAWFADVSTTRPDNFAPPRIVVGHPSAPRTVLTKQDRRSTTGEGWNGDGSWLLAADAQTSVEVVLVFPEPVDVSEARVHVGGEVVVREVGEEGTHISLGELALPAGNFELRVEVESSFAGLDVHQVVLTSS